MPEAAVVSRWHGVSSKYFCWARETKDVTVHGVLLPSSVALMTPWFVLIVAVVSPVTVAWSGGGVTSLAAGWPSAGKSHAAPPPASDPDAVGELAELAGLVGSLAVSEESSPEQPASASSAAPAASAARGRVSMGPMVGESPQALAPRAATGQRSRRPPSSAYRVSTWLTAMQTWLGTRSRVAPIGGSGAPARSTTAWCSLSSTTRASGCAGSRP